LLFYLLQTIACGIKSGAFGVIQWAHDVIPSNILEAWMKPLPELEKDIGHCCCIDVAIPSQIACHHYMLKLLTSIATWPF